MVKRTLAVLILLGLIFGGIFGWKRLQMERMAAMMSQPPPPATVAVTSVRREDWQRWLSAVGTVTANQGIFVTSEVPGQVREILFESGQPTRQGDILLKLDDSVDEAELRGLVAERDLAGIKYRRLARLLKDKSVSQSDVDEAKATLDSTEAQVASKRATIAKKTIRAPFSGFLGIRQVDLGEYLAPGSQVVPLEALESVYVDFALPERHFASLHAGQTVVLGLAAHPGKEFRGAITAINPGIDTATRTVRVRATLSNPDLLLRPGMFADVQVLLPARDDVLSLPESAVTYTPYGDAVFQVLEQEDQLQVQRRQVETGLSNNGSVEILQGLQEGDRVVLAGTVKLRNGQRVQIDNNVVPEQGAVVQSGAP